MQNMPSLLDRRRLKDRIVEGISKSVKQIQEYQFNQGENDVVLTNHDWQFCKLVEHLDHAFLHGLRHITNGYWPVVQDFTHKVTSKEIKRMTNVTTNLGRGRAWLYLALSDHLLESYLRCFVANSSALRRLYAREALVLDVPRMQILLTLAAGLEYITFQLDVDVPYLDLASHMRPRLPSQEDSLDRLSLSSMDSSVSQSSSSVDVAGSWTETMDYSSPTFQQTRFTSGENGVLMNGNLPPASSPVAATLTSSISMPIMPSRMERVSHIPSSTSLELNVNTEDLEVIHVKAKSHHTKRSRRAKRSTAGNSDADCQSLCSVASVSSDVAMKEKGSPEEGLSPLVDEKLKEESLEDKNLSNDKVEQQLSGTDVKETKIDSQEQAMFYIEKVSKVIETRMSVNEITEDPNQQEAVSKENKSMDETDVYKQREVAVNLANINPQGVLSQHVDKNMEVSEVLGEEDIYVSGFRKSNTRPESQQVEEGHHPAASPPTSPQTDEDPVEELKKEHSSPSEKEATRLGEECSPGMKGGEVEEEEKEADTIPAHPSEEKVDINFLLLLKLNVMQDDEEHLLKLYRTSMAHTEGEVQPIYLLISSLSLYIMERKFMQRDQLSQVTPVSFKDIDYLLVGVCAQILTVVCTNRRRQFHITSGDAQLTQAMVRCMEGAFRDSDRPLPKLNVLTEPSQQRIALCKWAAYESKAEMADTEVLSYSLIHWEDVSPKAHQLRAEGPRKEGMLLTRRTQNPQHNTSGTAKWQPSYLVLRDGILYQYADRSVGSLPKAYIQLSGEECVGCRRSPSSDRPHCLDLILSDGSVLQIAAANTLDAQNWLLELCRAVAEGSQSLRQSEMCLACCCVLTQNRILMCHEDLQTNFFRALGSTLLTDVMSVLIDPVVNTYLVIAFESQEASVKSGYWTLYFTSRLERDRFMECLSVAWCKHFQVAVPVVDLKDIAMVNYCRQGQARLQPPLL